MQAVCEGTAHRRALGTVHTCETVSEPEGAILGEEIAHTVLTVMNFSKQQTRAVSSKRDRNSTTLVAVKALGCRHEWA